MKDLLDDLIEQLRPAITPLVERIESSTPTTQNHYGEYMAAITRLAEMAGGGKSVKLGVALALQRCGANKQGVISALKAMGEI